MNQYNEDNAQGSSIPDWKCERYLLGELSPSEMQAMQRALRSDPGLRARLEALEQSNAETLRQYPTGWMAQQIRTRLVSEMPVNEARPASKRLGSWLRLPRMARIPGGLLALLLVVVLVLPETIPDGEAPTTATTRAKGISQQLRLYRKTATGSELLKNGDRATEHDLIRLQYETNAAGFGVILSLDGRGEITRQLPLEGGDAVALETPGAQFLDYAYELDDAPLWEIFLFVTSSAPFAVSTVEQALRELLPLASNHPEMRTPPLDHLDLPGGFHCAIFTLIKDSRDESSR